MSDIKTWAELPFDQRQHREAPLGKIWQCVYCAKKAEDRYGIIGWHSPGWDESCAMNSVLVDGFRPT